MEYRNCEQYVLDKLQVAENKNEVLKSRLDTLQANNDRLEKRMNKIKEILNEYGVVNTVMGTDGTPKNYIKVEVNQWVSDASEKYAFNKLIRFAHIKDEDGIPFDQEKPVQETAEPTEISEEPAKEGPETW